MSPKKLRFTFAVAAALALGACAWHETVTETVSSNSHTLNDGSALSSADMSSNTGATNSMGATGSTSHTFTRTIEMDGYGSEPVAR